MSTYGELVHLVLDELKLTSDDSHFAEEHVLFLLDRYRSFILKQRYSDLRKEVPESNYQTVCLNLEEVLGIDGVPCTGGHYLKSVEQIPHMMTIGARSITPTDIFQGNINYVSNERFKYVGHNKFLKKQIYATIAPDQHLYMKSVNCQSYFLRKIKVTGIFEDATKAAELQCDNENSACDIMEMTFPLEESLISPVIELVVKELSAFKLQPKDDSNNANDDLSDLAAFMKNQLQQGRYSDLYKQL